MDIESGPSRNGSSGPLKTLVLLCQSLEGLGNGLNLADVVQWLRETDCAVEVEVVPNLCRVSATANRVAASGAVRLVMGLCSAGDTQASTESRLREVGIDPLGVERVNLGGYCALAFPRPQATIRAKALLAAAVARARAFPGSGPDSVRPYLIRGEQKVSRRAIFTLPPVRHQPVASIRAERCAADAGCRMCVEVCPHDALRRNNRRVLLDKKSCPACGLCVVQCPRRAIELPTASLAQLEAEMTELLRTPAVPSSEPPAILFVCERNAEALEGLARKGYAYPVNWLPVRVPCVGMVPISWLLGCLAWGAGAVGVLECGGQCPFEQSRRTEGKVEYCHELLGLLGGSLDKVRLVSLAPEKVLAEALNRPIGPGVQGGQVVRQGPSLGGRKAAARAMRALAESYGASSVLFLAHPYSPLGLAHVDPDKCTACGGCARACPTGALALHERDDTVSLSFEAALCTACQQCIDWCPEAAGQALRIDRVTDLGALSKGRSTLYESRDVRCERCGSVIGTAAMLSRIETLLTSGGNASAAAVARIRRRCPSCRVAGVT